MKEKAQKRLLDAISDMADELVAGKTGWYGKEAVEYAIMMDLASRLGTIEFHIDAWIPSSEKGSSPTKRRKRGPNIQNIPIRTKEGDALRDAAIIGNWQGKVCPHGYPQFIRCSRCGE